MKKRHAVLLISSLLVVTFIGVATLLAVSSASAQTSTTGNIEGTVVDTTGAPIPGVTVSASRAGGGGASATTNDEGLFRLTNLQPGKYKLMIDATKGFAGFERANVEVNLSKTTKLNVSLNPAPVSGPVTVTQTSATNTPTPTSSNADDRQKTSSVQTSGGLHVVTFTLPEGRIKISLPDDMRAGDTISGTVVTEPKGNTEQEKTANDSRLRIHVIQLDDNTKVEPARPQFKWTPQLPTPSAPVRYLVRLFEVLGGKQTEVSNVQLSPGMPLPVEPIGKIPSTPGTSNFVIPPLGQSGRTIVITGPFDGDLSNTILRYGPANRTIHEFEKNSDSVSGGFGLLRTLAESPRKIVFESPTNVTGPMGIMVKEGDGPPTTGTYRNVGVNLSAPKTNLLKGEKTTLTVQVSGLEGIKEPVPLTLECEGVITMEGGPLQPLVIEPSQVNASGLYTTTRKVTGIMAGGWGATATVVTDRFNARLQDDTDPNRIFHFNSFTGEYVFACGGGSCRPSGSTGGTQTGGTTGKPGGTTPPGGTDTPPITPTGTTLTGFGKPVMKGCIITLSHNAPDRRVFARLDACTKSGDASVQTNSPKTDIKITDKNTTDNTAQSPPPK
ncbi:MAG: carboxypeptidase-like regulatory domain-containing protein [Pyrinomonadaceae bacterium]